jgi:hypothetical protein
MVMRVPLQSIMVQRDGKMVRPPIGKSFKFTDEEMADITRMNPKALGKVETVEIDDNANKKAEAEAKLLAEREEAQRQLDLKKSAAAAAPKGKGTAGADSL